MTLVSVTVSDHVAVLEMHDERRRNALGAAMIAGLIEAFDGPARSARAVVLRARASDPVWCAGFDIGALGPGVDPLEPSGALHGLFGRVAACRAPVIGMLHGSAWGGGTDLALRCDMLIADETATLAFTPARLGLPYDADGLLNAMGRGGRALVMEMFATAAPIGAERALQAGLVNRVVPQAALEAETMALARRVAANAPLTVASAKQHLRALARASALAPSIAAVLEDERRAALASADYREGLDAFRAKRDPVFTGQ